MKHIIELNAKYKIGHQQFSTPVAIIGRNIVIVEAIPEEIPDHQDGVLTRIQTSTGVYIGVSEPYLDVLDMWYKALEETL